VLAVLERDGRVKLSQIEARCADAFDAHGLKLARAAGCKTAQAACARWCPTVIDELRAAVLAWRPSWRDHLRFSTVVAQRFVSVGEASRRLGVGRSTVQRWVKVGQIRTLADGRVALWQYGVNCFPARPRLPAAPHEQDDAAQPPEPVPALHVAAAEPTDDDLTRLQAAVVNMAEGAQPVEPAPYSMTVRTYATFKAPGVTIQAKRSQSDERGVKVVRVPSLDGVERRADGFDSASNALRFAQTLEAAARWAMEDA